VEERAFFIVCVEEIRAFSFLSLSSTSAWRRGSG
jgi:hypothetical protein